MRALFVFYDVTDDWRRGQLAKCLRSADGQWLQRSAYGIVVPSRTAAIRIEDDAAAWLDRRDRMLAVAPCPTCTERVRFLPPVSRLWRPAETVHVAGGEDDRPFGGADESRWDDGPVKGAPIRSVD